MTQVSLRQFDELRAALKAKKAKREEKAKLLERCVCGHIAEAHQSPGAECVRFPCQCGTFEAVAWGRMPQVKRKARKGHNARKRAFLRLKAACKLFVALRAKKRTGGKCEVAVMCCGKERGVLAYHIFPAKWGNGTKYDVRNLLWACMYDNGSEFFDRKRGTYDRWNERHQEILGEDVWSELKGLSGRRQISTVEANAMAEELERRIEKGEWE